MTTITRKQLAHQQQFGGAPYGNLSVLSFNVTTNSSGVWTNGDSTSAPTASDKLVIGTLPAGFQMQDALMIVSDAFTATTTAKVGFEYADGVDSTAVPQDADYFTASLALNTAGRYRADNTAVVPVTLPKEANLVLDWDTATNAVAGVLDVLVYGVLTGAP